MKPKDDPAERRVRALLRSEAAVHERLQAVRSELIELTAVIDRVTLPSRRPIRSGISSGIGTLSDLTNLVPFRRRESRDGALGGPGRRQVKFK